MSLFTLIQTNGPYHRQWQMNNKKELKLFYRKKAYTIEILL